MSNLETEIHPTALVHPDARLGIGVKVGAYAIIEAGVQIGDNSTIAAHCLLATGTRLGANCRISKGAVLGTEPQDLKFGGEESALEVGDNTVIREFATLNRGTKGGHLKTVVGANCLLMAYSHVAHDCTLGEHCILANAVQLAGHVTIGDWACLGGAVIVHQFVKIGQHSFIGGGCRVSQDVPPYILTSGEPMGYFGPNVVGLRRRGFSPEVIQAIKKAYQFIYRSKLNLSQAIDAVKSQLTITPEINDILNFIVSSERGLAGR